VKGDSKSIEKYFINNSPPDALKRTSSGTGPGRVRPYTLQIPIAEEKSDPKEAGGE